METVAAIITDAAKCSSLVKCIDTLCCVLNDDEVVSLRDIHDGIHLAAYACVVDRCDDLSLVCYRIFDELLIDILGIRTDVHEDKLSASQDECVCCRYECIRRKDDLISRLYIRQYSCHVECC